VPELIAGFVNPEKKFLSAAEEIIAVAEKAGKAVPDLQAINKMREMTNLHPNYDCSEIADDLYRAAGNKGEIIKITPAQNYGDLNVIENGKIMAFDYHEVYSDGKYVMVHVTGGNRKLAAKDTVKQGAACP
jgi:hypothetical protein